MYYLSPHLLPTLPNAQIPLQRESTCMRFLSLGEVYFTATPLGLMLTRFTRGEQQSTLLVREWCIRSPYTLGHVTQDRSRASAWFLQNRPMRGARHVLSKLCSAVHRATDQTWFPTDVGLDGTLGTWISFITGQDGSLGACGRISSGRAMGAMPGGHPCYAESNRSGSSCIGPHRDRGPGSSSSHFSRRDRSNH
jgi:hypothetical protein